MYMLVEFMLVLIGKKKLIANLFSIHIIILTVGLAGYHRFILVSFLANSNLTLKKISKEFC